MLFRSDEMNTETAWREFKLEVDRLIDTYIPENVVKGAGKPRWLTSEIKRLMKSKREAWKKYREEGGAVNRESHRELSKKLKKKIRAAKNKMEKELANGEDRNGRKFKNYIKMKTKARTGSGPLRKEDGNTTSEPAEMSEILKPV